ncbi:MAG: hypothetical protein WC894_05485 [Patescibacteria group bacterium]
MNKANIIKKIITAGILVAAMVLFFGASKHRLPAPENLVAQVLMTTGDKNNVISAELTEIPNEEGVYPLKYQFEFFGNKSLRIIINLSENKIESISTKVFLKFKKINTQYLQNVIIKKDNGKLSFQASISDWLWTYIGLGNERIEVKANSIDLKGNFSNPVKAQLKTNNNVASPVNSI